MTKKIKEQTQIHAYFTPEGFIIEDILENAVEGLQGNYQAFEVSKMEALYALGFKDKAQWFSPAIEFLYHIAEEFIKRISQLPDLELSRENAEAILTEEMVDLILEELPFVLGMEHVNYVWLQKLWTSLQKVYKKEIQVFEGSIARYFNEKNSHINIVGRVFFHLVENKEGDLPFAFMATYSVKPVKSKRTIHTPLKTALEEFKGADDKLFSLISTVVKASEKSMFVSDLLESGELFSPIELDMTEAYEFLKDVPIFEAAGIMCRVPDWWRKKSNAIKLSVSVGEKIPSHVGLDAIMDFSPRLTMGQEKLSEAELRDFLTMAEGLLLYKGQWIEINQKKLESLLEAFDQVKSLSEDDQMTVGEAMRLQLNMNDLVELSDPDIDVSVSNGAWFKKMRDTLTGQNTLPKIEVEPTFLGTLRNYQDQGFAWLNQMSKLGFGACLADDMGLGKTVQMIAFLESARVDRGGHALLVLPASLIGNWQMEVEKFAPLMPYQILHKSKLKKGEVLSIDHNKFLIITTYGMAVRLEELQEFHWDYLILDEAQAIKNPGTKQTKAIKSIPATMYIAMTGTPIENRLSDLWSLFDFLNKGLLGTPKEFKKFTKELSEHATGYAKLRKMIQPFILRRMKTDKSIITDLPDKIEMNNYTTLSQKQVLLYKKLLKDIEHKLLTAEGIERKGLVLSSIMKFKQICNHPDQYLGKEDFKPDHSGKFMQLKEICETIYQKRERVLVFSQFREMTEPLAAFLETIFHKPGLVLHGGTPIKKRQEMVEEFNGEHYVPFMVLSLKAGGVGLNLTSANHAIHFDRWWNPAVENQATDRIFRIGQKKNVMVHKFVTKGSIEEKINEMIEAKQKLSGDILMNSGEQWITEYNNEELLNIFKLGGDV